MSDDYHWYASPGAVLPLAPVELPDSDPNPELNLKPFPGPNPKPDEAIIMS